MKREREERLVRICMSLKNWGEILTMAAIVFRVCYFLEEKN